MISRDFLFLMMNSSANFETFIQRGLFDNVKRKTTVNRDYIEFEDKNLIGAENSRLFWKDFDAIRYGYERIRGYSFYIGLRRKIYIRNKDHDEIKISIASVYNFRHKQRNREFSEILNAIFDFFLNDHVANLIKSIESGETLNLSKVQVSNSKVSFLIKKIEVDIDFLVLNMASYNRFFHIYSEADKEKTIRIDYLEDWNSMILYSVLKYFLKK
jgi:hypothetical protein